MGNLKVGFDAHVLDGRFQGSRTVIMRLAESLASYGSDVRVYLYSQTSQIGRVTPHSVEHAALESGSSWHRLSFALPHAVSRDCLDAMIYQYICAPWSPKSWVIIHDILPITHPHLFRTLFRIRSALLFTLTILTSKNIIVVSQYTAESIVRTFPFARNKVHVVLNGPSFPEDVYFMHVPGREIPVNREVGRYVLAVGRIEKRKNIELLVDAFVEAAVPEVTLIIVGALEPGERPIRDADNVICLQGIDQNSLEALHRHADLFVYASEAEGFGIPLLDAVLFGTPTLSSNRTAMPEVGGDLAEYFDPTAQGARHYLAQRIASHFGDRPVPPPSISARRMHAKKFSWRNSAETLSKLLRGAAADKN